MAGRDPGSTPGMGVFNFFSICFFFFALLLLRIFRFLFYIIKLGSFHYYSLLLVRVDGA